MYHPYIEYSMLDAKAYNEKYIEIKRQSLAPTINEWLEGYFSNAEYSKTPLLGTMLNCGTWFFAYVFVAFYSVYRKKWNAVLPLALLAGLYITFLLSPVCLFRYAFPFVSCAPIMLAIVLSRADGDPRRDCDRVESIGDDDSGIPHGV